MFRENAEFSMHKWHQILLLFVSFTVLVFCYLAIRLMVVKQNGSFSDTTRVGTLIVETIYLQLIQNRYMFRSFTLLHCSHQHCVQPVASDVEVVGYL